MQPEMGVTRMSEISPRPPRQILTQTLAGAWCSYSSYSFLPLKHPIGHFPPAPEVKLVIKNRLLQLILYVLSAFVCRAKFVLRADSTFFKKLQRNHQTAALIGNLIFFLSS